MDGIVTWSRVLGPHGIHFEFSLLQVVGKEETSETGECMGTGVVR